MNSTTPNAIPSEAAWENGVTLNTTPVPASAEKKLTSRYRGVCWNRKNRRWQAAINRAGQYIYLGSFVSEEDAARAFDRAAVKIRGHSTKINFDFEDYEEELSWHKQNYRTGSATDAVLKDPKILRDQPPAQTNIMQHHNQQPARRQAFPSQFQPAQPNPPYASVVAQRQTQSFKIGLPHPNFMSHAGPRFPIAAVPNQPVMNLQERMMTRPSMNFSNTNLNFGVKKIDLTPNHVAPYPSPVPPEAPPMTDSQIKTQQPTINIPSGSTQTHFFPGAGNSFALAYVRNDSPGIQVSVFDGRVMTDIGVFTTTQDATQVCKSLLGILEKVQSANSSTSSQGSLPRVDIPTQNKQINGQLSSQSQQPSQGLHTADSLPQKSPFDIKPGKEPNVTAGGKGDGKWFSHEAVKKSVSGSCSIPLQGRESSISEKMGSLLDMSNNQFEGLGSHLPPTLPASIGLMSAQPLPQTSPTGIPGPAVEGRTGGSQGVEHDDSNMRLSPASLSMLSRSLENLVTVLSQSGQIIGEKSERKEGEETELPSQPSIDLHLEKNSFVVNSAMHHPSVTPYVYSIHNTINTQDCHPSIPSQQETHTIQSLGKRRVESPQENEITKKPRETAA